MRQLSGKRPHHLIGINVLKKNYLLFLMLIIPTYSNSAFADTAFRDMLVLADQGNAYAQNYVGKAYQAGDVVIQDAVIAVKWFNKAALQGDRNAQYNLALCYWTGAGIPQDQTAAIALLIKSGDAHHSRANFMLGTINERGKWVDQNYAAVSYTHLTLPTIYSV